MRLVEVVMLMGAHCVSPVEHSQLMTEATKVQCAVVVEKDTDSGTLRVTPQAASGDPRVAKAVAHLNGVAQTGARIVPTGAPPVSPSAQVQPAPAAAANPPAQPLVPPTDEKIVAAEDVAAAPAAQEPAPAAEPATRKVVAAPPAEPKKLAAATPAPAQKKKQQAEAAPKQPAGQCKGAAVAKWYKAADGHRKYRCVRPVPTSDAPPAQLY